MNLERLSFIERGTAKAGAVSISVPKGVYAGLFVRIFGTTDAGQTLALADIGRMRVQRNGQEVIAETFDFFALYDDLKAGTLPPIAAAAASAENVVCFIPFALPEMRNTSNVKTNTEMDLNCDFNGTTLTTRFGANACTYEVYGYMFPDVPERYQLLIREQDEILAAAGRVQIPVNGRNVAAIYLQDTSDVVDNVSYNLDGQVVVDNIDEDFIRAVTGFENAIETYAAAGLAEISVAQTGQLQNMVNGGGRLDATFNAAGTLGITVFQILDIKQVRA